MRRASDSALSPKAISKYQQLQTIESVLLAHGIFQQPHTWMSQVER